MSKMKADLTTSCRRCGATGNDPEAPTEPCTQCRGMGEVVLGVDNPVGPGVDRLVAAAKAQAPEPNPRPMMILWDEVKGRERVLIVQRLRDSHQQRNRGEKKLYRRAVRAAVKLGILVEVPDPPKKGGAENLQKPN